MLRFVLIVTATLILFTCQKDEVIPTPVLDLCQEQYFYYSGGGKNYFKHSLQEVYLVMEQDTVSKTEAESILATFDFVDSDLSHYMTHDENYNQIWVKINEKGDCSSFRNKLKEINADPNIFSATPVFYYANDPLAYWVLLSEVVTKHDEQLINEEDFINYAENINLELIDSSYSTHHYKVKEVVTGFEALEISNQLYVSDSVVFAHPNFIARIVLN